MLDTIFTSDEFDIQTMFNDVKAAIEKFASEHPIETFYALSVDSGMVSINTEKDWEVTFKEALEEDGERLKNPCYLDCLRYNTGNWMYQDMYDLNESRGFDYEAYDQHYHVWFEEELSRAERETAQRTSPYRVAMRKLIGMLFADGIFDRINTSDGFRVFLSEED